MNPSHRNQSGEGKIGCLVSFVIFVVVVAVGFKAVPVYWNNNELKDAAKDLASRASVTPVANIELQMRGKAKDLEIGEALAPGAIKVTKSSSGDQGTCTIRMKYSQKIDFYGVYQWTVDVNEAVSAPYLGGL